MLWTVERGYSDQLYMLLSFQCCLWWAAEHVGLFIYLFDIIYYYLFPRVSETHPLEGSFPGLRKTSKFFFFFFLSLPAPVLLLPTDHLACGWHCWPAVIWLLAGGWRLTVFWLPAGGWRWSGDYTLADQSLLRQLLDASSLAQPTALSLGFAGASVVVWMGWVEGSQVLGIKISQHDVDSILLWVHLFICSVSSIAGSIFPPSF